MDAHILKNATDQIKFINSSKNGKFIIEKTLQ
jgi:hypothetical protein